MENDSEAVDFILMPGHVCVPTEPTRLASVVTSGVAATFYDASRRRGGMAHYVRPVREAGCSTAVYAAPALVATVEMMFSLGSRPADLEAFLYGAADNENAAGYEPDLAVENLRVGRDVLRKLGVSVAGEDAGGSRARKIVFHSTTGETMVARVDRVRAGDWYPTSRSDASEGSSR